MTELLNCMAPIAALRVATGGSALLPWSGQMAWPELQEVEIGSQMPGTDRADGGRIQIRVGKGDAENELHRAHAVEQVVEGCWGVNALSPGRRWL